MNPAWQNPISRVLQGHSGGVRVGPASQNKVQIPHGWLVFYISRQINWDSCYIVNAGLLGGGRGDRQGQQTCFFTAVDPLHEFDADQLHDRGKPQIVQYEMRWK